MVFKNLSIARRLTLVLTLILGLALVSSLFATARLRQVTSEMETMVARDLQTERATADWLRVTSSAVMRTSAIAKSSDTALVPYFAEMSKAGVAEANGLSKRIEETITTAEERDLLARITSQRATFAGARDEITGLKKAGDSAAAERVLTDRFEPAAREYMASVKGLNDLERQRLDAAATRIRELRDQTSWLLGGCCALMLAIGSALAVTLSRSITRPLAEAEAAASAIGRMDLTGAPQSVYANDETGRLLRSIDGMRGALTQSLLQVRNVVDSISTASTQIASGNQDLSARTEQTASNLQQTASSMEELTGTVHSSADAASQANQLAASATAVAQRGGEAMARVVKTMDDINAASKKISDIIGVIDGIAFQTNILALNAAVEAARAGEQGRGFAVVASEVRSLAQRSADAAKEIKGLIGISVDKVETGARLVGDAGATMSEIVGSVQRVTDIIGEITAAAAEQSQGIGQVNNAVSQLDQMTQQNAALVEESAAAAESLREQSHKLSDVVGGFRLSALA